MKVLFSVVLLISFSMFADAQNWDSLSKVAAKTEVWEPVLTVVTSGETPQDPPSDAIILFGGNNLDKWRSVNDTTSPANWIVEGDQFTVNKKSGNIETKERFMDYQLHLEWKIPADIDGEGQGRGNSGVFLASTGPGDAGYEMQIMDSYNNPTYVNGQAASVYKQGIPLVNASKKPGEWQSYDIVWTAPRFNADRSLLSPARLTAFQNGVLVQNNFELHGQTLWTGSPFYKPHGASPIKLQAHGDSSKPISFRNIWIRKL